MEKEIKGNQEDTWVSILETTKKSSRLRKAIASLKGICCCYLVDTSCLLFFSSHPILLLLPKTCFLLQKQRPKKAEADRHTHTCTHTHTHAHTLVLKSVKIIEHGKPKFNMTLSLINDVLFIFFSLQICFLTTGRVE